MASTIFEPAAVVERGSKEYPTRDGRPMGETDYHRTVMFETIETLKAYYTGQQVYVTGNLLVYYRQGDKRRHVSPDAMVVKGVEPGLRLNYLVWEEGRSPDVVIEITSASTRREDLKIKFDVYRTEMRVKEYFLFDPRDEYLSPTLQGFRLAGDQYVPIEPVGGRLPSQELGLSLEAAGEKLRFYDPVRGGWLPTYQEVREQAERENERLRRELDELRKRLGGANV